MSPTLLLLLLALAPAHALDALVARPGDASALDRARQGLPGRSAQPARLEALVPEPMVLLGRGSLTPCGSMGRASAADLLWADRVCQADPHDPQAVAKAFLPPDGVRAWGDYPTTVPAWAHVLAVVPTHDTSRWSDDEVAAATTLAWQAGSATLHVALGEGTRAWIDGVRVSDTRVLSAHRHLLRVESGSFTFTGVLDLTRDQAGEESAEALLWSRDHKDGALPVVDLGFLPQLQERLGSQAPRRIYVDPAAPLSAPWGGGLEWNPDARSLAPLPPPPDRKDRVRWTGTGMLAASAVTAGVGGVMFGLWYIDKNVSYYDNDAGDAEEVQDTMRENAMWVTGSGLSLLGATFLVVGVIP